MRLNYLTFIVSNRPQRSQCDVVLAQYKCLNHSEPAKQPAAVRPILMHRLLHQKFASESSQLSAGVKLKSQHG